MNKITTRIPLALFLLALSPLCLPYSIDQSFLETVERIRPELYHISAAELQKILGIDFKYIPTIPADELKKTMREKPDLRVINVLPRSLHKDCHITGSINVPLKELVDTCKSWDKSTEIAVYCALNICDAGQKAYMLLHCMGFFNVVDYKGGIKEWYQLGYPTTGPTAQSYLHAKAALLPEELLRR